MSMPRPHHQQLQQRANEMYMPQTGRYNSHSNNNTSNSYNNSTAATTSAPAPVNYRTTVGTAKDSLIQAVIQQTVALNSGTHMQGNNNSSMGVNQAEAVGRGSYHQNAYGHGHYDYNKL